MNTGDISLILGSMDTVALISFASFQCKKNTDLEKEIEELKDCIYEMKKVGSTKFALSVEKDIKSINDELKSLKSTVPINVSADPPMYYKPKVISADEAVNSI